MGEFPMSTRVLRRASQYVVRRLFVPLLAASLAFGTNGSFVGRVVKGPNTDASRNWLYVQSPHGSVRRVDVSAAKIGYAAGVEKKDRAKDAVREGAQVRVTASQDGEGEWKATKVEIVRLAPN
jgi:hypothetical protein